MNRRLRQQTHIVNDNQTKPEDGTDKGGDDARGLAQQKTSRENKNKIKSHARRADATDREGIHRHQHDKSADEDQARKPRLSMTVEHESGQTNPADEGQPRQGPGSKLHLGKSHAYQAGSRRRHDEPGDVMEIARALVLLLVLKDRRSG